MLYCIYIFIVNTRIQYLLVKYRAVRENTLITYNIEIKCVYIHTSYVKSTESDSNTQNPFHS